MGLVARKLQAASCVGRSLAGVIEPCLSIRLRNKAKEPFM